jgi:hypothetical protein
MLTPMRRPRIFAGTSVVANERQLRRVFRAVLLSMVPALAAGAQAASCDKSDAPRPTDAGPHDATVDAERDVDLGDTSCLDVPVFAPVVCGDEVYIGDPYLACGRSVGGCYFYRDFSCPIFSIIPAAENQTPNPCGIAIEDCLKVCTADGGEFLPLDGGPIPRGEVWECLYTAGCETLPMGDGGYGPQIMDAGPYTIACGVCPGVGRRPAGLRPGRSPRGTSVSRHFEAMAHLEAASVHAFERLARELRAHGAPPALVRTARRSARDEVRHARLAGGLAKRFGGKPAKAYVRRHGVRSMGRMAKENAVEGCVHETYGALVALWQATHARDPHVRSCMRTIAKDELRHAALAWTIAEWAEQRLDASGRARVMAARSRALHELGLQVEAAAPSLVRDVVGLPSCGEARALLDGWVKGLV